MKCSIEGCEREKAAKGFCGAHYQRNREGKDMTTPISNNLGNGRRLSHQVERTEALVVTITLPPWAAERVEVRAKLVQIEPGLLVQAMVERWAMTDGAEWRAERRPDEKAWAHLGSRFEER